MNRPPSRRPYGQQSTARPPSRRPYGQQRAKSTAEDKPRQRTPRPGISLSDVNKSMSRAANAVPGVAAAKSSLKFGNKLGTFLAKKARQILQIPKGKGVDTKYRGVR